MTNDMQKMKIGVFDSGFGGLDIFRNIAKTLPEYDFIYLGDTARTPYGTRSKETVYEYSKQAVRFLFQKDCQLVIFACNTASADALSKIQHQFIPENFSTKEGVVNKKALGVIIPAIEEAAATTKNNKVGIIATEGSVKSNTFVEEMRKQNPNVEVFQQSAPLLVPIVESGDINEFFVYPIIEKYLQPLIEKQIDTLVLGCTHYGILKEQIQKTLDDLGSEAKIVSEGEVVAKKLKDYLNRHPEIDKLLSKKSNQVFYTTDLTDRFKKIGSELVGREINVEVVSLE
jgi:glutamate racemase